MRFSSLATWFFALTAALVLPLPAPAQDAGGDPDAVLFGADASAPALTVVAGTEPAVVPPGGKFDVVVHLTVAPKQHAYPNAAQNPADPSTVYFTAPGGAQFGEPVWPKGQIFEVKELDEKEVVYKGEVLIRIPGTASQTPGEHTIKGAFKGRYCDDAGSCYPSKVYPWEAKVTVDPKAVAQAPTSAAPTAAPHAPAAGGASKSLEAISFDLPWGTQVVDPNTARGLAVFLLLAALGGLVLNFMPCVLPVIPIKILGLAQAAGTRNRRLFLGAVMSGGVVALWLGIGSVLAFTSVLGGTADIFRYPLVNLLLGAFIVLMAFGATGLFAIRLPQAVYSVNPKHDSAFGSFAFGVMTGVFALPCTGPFMGTAAAAVLRAGNSTLTLAVFAAIGLGMALPYFVLAANPKWVDKLPRSGPASDVMKTFLGWLMLAGGAYFIQSGITQWASPESHFGKRAGVIVALALFTVAGGLLAKGCIGLLKAPPRRALPAVFLAAGLGLAAFGTQQIYSEIATRPFPFVRFTGEAELRLGQGKIVVVDFRSTNCLNCDLNEKRVFNTPDGRALLGADDVAAYQANTDRDLDTAFLKKIASNVAVPFLAVYDAKDTRGERVIRLDGTLSADQLRQALEKARQAGK